MWWTFYLLIWKKKNFFNTTDHLLDLVVSLEFLWDPLKFSELNELFLFSARVHMESGFSFSPPQPTVRTTKTEVCSFIKDDNTATGAVGVLTYEMFHMREQSCSELIAIMFSVPFDYTFYKNWLGVGIFDKARGCDDKLFDHMYNSKDFTSFVRQEASGSGVLYQGKEVDVRACMSNEGKAIIKLELYDKMGRWAVTNTNRIQPSELKDVPSADEDMNECRSHH